MKTSADIERLQTISSTYWAECADSYLASAQYYDAQERALREQLSALGSIASAVDIGCGDGRYTRVIKDLSSEVWGIDLSPALIEEAKVLSSEREDSAALHFQCIDLNVWRPDHSFDLVSCLGVTSTLIDAARFVAFSELLAAITKPRGWIALKDTLSLGEDTIAETGDY
jgi:trans-aconitate methyltransferase